MGGFGSGSVRRWYVSSATGPEHGIAVYGDDGTLIGEVGFQSQGVLESTAVGLGIQVAALGAQSQPMILMGSAGVSDSGGVFPASIWAFQGPVDSTGMTWATADAEWQLNTEGFSSMGDRAPSFALGDIDGDGQGDLVVGAPFDESGRGAVYVVPAIAQLAPQSAPYDISQGEAGAVRVLVGSSGVEGLGQQVAVIPGLHPHQAGLAVTVPASAGQPGVGPGRVYVFRARDLLGESESVSGGVVSLPGSGSVDVALLPGGPVARPHSPAPRSRLRGRRSAWDCTRVAVGILPRSTATPENSSGGCPACRALRKDGGERGVLAVGEARAVGMRPGSGVWVENVEGRVR